MRIVVRMEMMKMARRNRTEWDGPRMCAMAERSKRISVRAAAMTWTIRIFDKPLTADGGSEKLSELLLLCRATRDRLLDGGDGASFRALSSN